MGDRRFAPHYRDLAQAADRPARLRAMADEEVIGALAAASREHDALLANVLATEALNRVHRSRAALENLGEGVLTVDTEERVVFANPAALRLLRTEAPLDGRDLHASIHLPTQATQPCALQEVMRTRQTLQREDEQFLRPDGASFPVAYTAAPLLREGDVEGAVLVFRDVTERVRTEAALRESVARERSLAEAAFEAILIHEGGRILAVNRAAERLLGLAAPEAIGRCVLEFVALESHAQILEALARETEETVAFRGLRADGEPFLAQARARPCPWEGRPARVVAVRDVAERERDQREIREREQRYRSLFDQLPFPAFSLDLLGRFHALNPACEELTGRPADALVGRPLFALVAPRSARPASHACRKAMQGERAQTPVSLRARDGRVHQATLWTAPILVDGEVTGIHGVLERAAGPA